jgi:putative restriction endonuclease
MRYWWVNQNQTRREEIVGGFMWSPKRNANGVRNQFYENMRDVSPGDVIFSFWDTRIQAIGIARGRAETAPKPDFSRVGMNWAQEGWYVPVDYLSLDNRIRPKDHIDVLRPFLPSKYSPLQLKGDGLQSVYLAEVPLSLADALMGLIGQAYDDAYAALAALRETAVLSDEEDAIDSVDQGITGPTFREQIVRARRGQGIFRSNVLLRETRCRVTGVNDPKHLKASHIKPWRVANDTERLDGSNGLLLSPHIDHLFDAGFITFSANQELLVVPSVRNNLCDAWGIDPNIRVGEFTREQNAYLEFHRANVFKRALFS